MKNLFNNTISDLNIYKNLTDIINKNIVTPAMKINIKGSDTLWEIIYSIASKDIITDSDKKLLGEIKDAIEKKLFSDNHHTNRMMLEEISFLTNRFLDSPPAPLEGYQKDAITALSALGGIQGKIVLEAAADLNLAVARALIALNAKKVIAVNPAIPQDYKSPDKKIVLLRQSLEEVDMEAESVDAILGIAILEHMDHPGEFAAHCKKLLKTDGSMFLTGGPMWTSHGGHHIWLPKLPSGREYYFHIKEKNPFEPWEHLNFKSRADGELALKNKNIPEDDIPFILDQLFLDKHISRLSPAEIENLFRNIFGDAVKFDRWCPYDQKNRYFFEALGEYSQQDLLSWALIISKSCYPV